MDYEFDEKVLTPTCSMYDMCAVPNMESKRNNIFINKI